MWLSRPLVRTLLLALALSATAGLSACTGIRPLYGEAGTGISRHVFAYGEPASRLDQVIYTELRLRLGPNSVAPDAVRVSVSSYSYGRALTKTNVSRPSQQYEMIAVANVSISGPDGQNIFTGQRRATAAYQVVSQVLADNAAAAEASDRAGRALAETLRLTILAALDGS